MLNKMLALFNRKKKKALAVAFDGMQQYTKTGQYEVSAEDGTPYGQNYTLTVSKTKDGRLSQALTPIGTESVTPVFTRKWDKRLNRFRPFSDANTGRRYIVKQYIDEFLKRIEEYIDPQSINIGLITDTHDKDVDAIDFYGTNGLLHVKEFDFLARHRFLDLKAHLGDWIDGSDAGFISEHRLLELQKEFSAGDVPFINVKGNHDENDKFDEHQENTTSFPAGEFERIMYPGMYRQPEINYVTKKNGVGYFDKDDLRVLFVNTSDIPYILQDDGTKKYDTKLTLAVREDQVEEIIEILEQSSGKQVVVLGHGNLINRKGNNALKYNGRTLHELFVAFNQRETGYLHTTGVPEEFMLNNRFDFSNVKDAKIFGYICGHRHVEDQYRINGIQYVLLNCSALMGRNYALTTTYNKQWQRTIDTPTEYAGYVLSVNIPDHRFQVFGYGASSFRRVFKI